MSIGFKAFIQPLPNGRHKKSRQHEGVHWRPETTTSKINIRLQLQIARRFCFQCRRGYLILIVHRPVACG